MEKLEYSEFYQWLELHYIWKTVNTLKFCDFEKLQSLFYFEMNHFMCN